MPIDIKDYFSLMLERPRKFTPEQVGYVKAPEGSQIICASCINYYLRARDGHQVCQIMRSEETDEEGVLPEWRCRFYTCTGDFFPLLESEPEADDHGGGEQGDDGGS